MFNLGEQLLPLLDATVRPQIALFGQGGRAILGAIRAQNYQTILSRPSLSKWRKGRLVLGGFVAAKIASTLHRSSGRTPR
jgi:phytoene/squalene synthetase